MTGQLSCDIAIIGSGAGGGTMAYALRDSGASVLILERGGFLPRESENWSPEAVVTRGRYKAEDPWEVGDALWEGSNHYWVGGMSKAFGATLARMFPQDFETYELDDGVSPSWPFGYETLEPYYGRAEVIWGVRGSEGDPLAPPRSTPYAHPPLKHEPLIGDLAERLRQQGLHPYTLPMGVAFGDGGGCVRCRYCDGFPCLVGAKCDAEMRCVRPALDSPTVAIKTDAFVERLATDSVGKRVVAAEARINGEHVTVKAGRFVLAAGAGNSAAILLRSASSAHPAGLANSSDQVGRNYISHRNSSVIALYPTTINGSGFQKTMGLNDFYLAADGRHPRLGSLQLTGKVLPEHVSSEITWLPHGVARWITRRSIDWWAMTEDLPRPENRVVLGKGGRIRLQIVTETGMRRHRALVAKTKRMMFRAGYPIVLSRQFKTNAEQIGTLKLGTDPSMSVLDPFCKAHDLSNLWAVDASFLPSAGAGPGGPTLTIAAQALRVVDKSDLTS
jgi:choline dehydrogenase-like flavoprotein